MPNYYAHLQFGAQVLDVLPEHLRLCLEKEHSAYVLGLYGPDPLYFSFDGKVRALGRKIHRQSVRALMEPLQRAVREEVPFSAGYAAGLLCHFALDSQCHAYIGKLSDADRISHTGIEVEFDRFLMVRDGVNYLSETPFPVPSVPGVFYGMLERYIYPGVLGKQYRNGLEWYRKMNCWHTQAAINKLSRYSLDRMALWSRQGKIFRDMALKRESIFFSQYNEEMLALLQKEVPVIAEKLSDFFAGCSLDAWFNRDFFGRPGKFIG